MVKDESFNGDETDASTTEEKDSVMRKRRTKAVCDYWPCWTAAEVALSGLQGRCPTESSALLADAPGALTLRAPHLAWLCPSRARNVEREERRVSAGAGGMGGVSYYNRSAGGFVEHDGNGDVGLMENMTRMTFFDQQDMLMHEQISLWIATISC